MQYIKASTIALLFSVTGAAQTPPPASQGQQSVNVRELRVKGSRLPGTSIARLSQLQPGQNLNEDGLRKALQAANQSGLFKNIAYSYESVPDSTTDVILELVIEDQLPLVPATVKIPKVDPEDVWRYLVSVDPLFTRELPPTAKAIDLYAKFITKYLESVGVVGFAVRGDVLGADQPSAIEFVTVKLRSASAK
jgi:hypothetical protein